MLSPNCTKISFNKVLKTCILLLSQYWTDHKANAELDPDYELTRNDTYGISINFEAAPEETDRMYTDGIKALPNAVYGVRQGCEHLQEVCYKLDGTDGVSVLSAFVTVEPNELEYDSIDCLKAAMH